MQNNFINALKTSKFCDSAELRNTIYSGVYGLIVDRIG